MTFRPTRADDERGAVMIIATVGIVLAMISAALAVDLGRLAADKRADQKLADLGALDASRNVNAACQRAKDSMQRHGLARATLVCNEAIPPTNAAGDDVLLGTISAAGTFIPDLTGKVVQVKVRSSFSAAFPFVSGPDRTSGKAMAAIEDKAQVSVGSTLANFSAASLPVLNPVLTQFLGLTPPAALSLVSYQGLAQGSVSINEIAAADASLGTPSQLLNTSVSLKKVALATIQALNNRGAGDTAAVAAMTALATFASNIDSSINVKLSDMVGIQQPASDAALASQLNVFDLIVGSGETATAAKVITGTNFIDVPGLTLGIPGLTSSTLRLWVIQAPQISMLGRARCSPPLTGTCDTVAKTVQIKLDLSTHITLGTPAVAAVPPVCVALVCTPGVPAVPAVTTLDLGLPISVSAAKATASLTDISACSPASSTASVRVDTEASTVSGTAAITVPPLGSVPLTNISLAQGTTSPQLVFTGPPFPTASQPAASQGLDLTGLTTGVPVLAPVVKPLLDPVLTNINNTLFTPLFNGLGLSFAGADTTVLQIVCGVPALLG